MGTIGIVGNGVVGNATAKAFAPFCEEVRIHDRIAAKSTHSLIDTLEADIVFLCLPTPQDNNGLRCDTWAIDSFFLHGLPDQLRTVNLVLRSTVPVGCTASLAHRFGLPNLVHCPEFLTARTAEHDAAHPTRNVIGIPHMPNKCAAALRELLGRAHPEVPLFCVSSQESEFVKLMQNAFSAVKVAFFNEMRAYSDKLGMDWGICREALLAGGWINPTHTQVPGPDGKRGFGGACLPKDLANLMHCFLNAKCDPLVLGAAHTRNKFDRERQP